MKELQYKVISEVLSIPDVFVVFPTGAPCRNYPQVFFEFPELWLSLSEAHIYHRIIDRISYDGIQNKLEYTILLKCTCVQQPN